jgi:hypothetical protein
MIECSGEELGDVMASLDEYSELVSAIYDAAADSERWPVALERLCDALTDETFFARLKSRSSG